MTGPSLKKTRLHDWHLGAGARMGEFAGWDMPIQYPSGPREEHMRVRSAAGLFDIDHMGRFMVSGRHALDFLQYVQTWDVSRIRPGRAHYSLLCAPSGGILDDLFIYRLSADEWLVVVNAANRAKDFARFSENAAGFGAPLRDASAETCLVSLQGPAAARILSALTDPASASIGHHHVTRCSVAGAECVLCVTGYTGEPGYEILVEAARALDLWRTVLEAGSPLGLLPCGLAARDTLRAEAALPLYGQELREDTDPFSAGLGKAAVSLEGHEFIGRAALLEASRRPPERTLVCFRMTEASVPRHGYPIVSGGRPVGEVTTGLFGPAANGYIGMGYVERAFSGMGTPLEVAVRGVAKEARVVERPFYRSPHWKKEK